jgi:hypothetical protein
LPCPLCSGLVRRIKSYPGTSSNTNVSAYTSNGSVKHIMSQQVISTMWWAPLAKHAWESPRKKLAPDWVHHNGHVPGQMPSVHNHAHQPMVKGFLPLSISENKFSHNVSKRMLTFHNYCHIPNFDHRVSANNPRVRNNPNNAKTRRNVSGDTSWLMQLPAFSQFN